MTNEYKEVEVLVVLGGYEMTAFLDVPTNLSKDDLFRFILDYIELGYDDEWVRS